MRAMLVVNPKATATTERQRDILARALGSDLKVDLAQTTHRGHAIEYARQAREEGFDVVVVLGGDGTINEVVNGLLGSGPFEGYSPDTPALAVVPGGSTNVFARALEMARDPVVATSELLDALRANRSRQIGLGRVDDRWFTFTAGLGIDADAVRRVEKARAKGRRATPSLYTRCTASALLSMNRRHGPLTLELPGEEPEPGLFMGIAANTSPWTYFRSKPIVLTRDVTFDTGLDLVALNRMGLVGTLWSASGMLTEDGIRGRRARVYRNLPQFRLVSESPIHLQVDGDYIGEVEAADFVSVPHALRVIA
ncbi:MAG: diacylglycerol kinase family lipid kinase [Frankiaceae bacterium]|nr:diacylglycerol kinase family lipid kinase [Frankiaceae bacterium]MBV9872750.1 diacylglycerol kinase family lipid kinase [Frankiaceae bacterium]